MRRQRRQRRRSTASPPRRQRTTRTHRSRYAGYGPRPTGRAETRPASYFDSLVGDDVYEAQNIVGMRVRDGRTEYRVRWKGYAPHEDTWEPLEHLRNAKELLRNFHKRRRRCRQACLSIRRAVSR